MSETLTKVTRLEGFHAVYPGQNAFERIEAVGKRAVCVYDLCPVGAGTDGDWTITVEFTPKRAPQTYKPQKATLRKRATR